MVNSQIANWLNKQHSKSLLVKGYLGRGRGWRAPQACSPNRGYFVRQKGHF